MSKHFCITFHIPCLHSARESPSTGWEKRRPLRDLRVLLCLILQTLIPSSSSDLSLQFRSMIPSFPFSLSLSDLPDLWHGMPSKAFWSRVFIYLFILLCLYWSSISFESFFFMLFLCFWFLCNWGIYAVLGLLVLLSNEATWKLRKISFFFMIFQVNASRIEEKFGCIGWISKNKCSEFLHR